MKKLVVLLICCFGCAFGAAAEEWNAFLRKSLEQARRADSLAAQNAVGRNVVEQARNNPALLREMERVLLGDGAEDRDIAFWLFGNYVRGKLPGNEAFLLKVVDKGDDMTIRRLVFLFSQVLNPDPSQFRILNVIAQKTPRETVKRYATETIDLLEKKKNLYDRYQQYRRTEDAAQRAAIVAQLKLLLGTDREMAATCESVFYSIENSEHQQFAEFVFPALIGSRWVSRNFVLSCMLEPGASETLQRQAKEYIVANKLEERFRHKK